MKLAIVLGLVIAGLCLGGAAYYQHSTGTQDKLQQDLNQAVKTNSSLIADLASAKANVEALRVIANSFLLGRTSWRRPPERP